MPGWLEGDLLRTGPALFEIGGRPLNHWFDGLAMLHRFSISGGSVFYNNRFLHSAAYRASQEGKIGYREFATDPCFSLFGQLKALFIAPKFTDNCNVSVQALDGKIVALTETTMPLIFDRETLESQGVFGFDDRLGGQITFAHPHYDFARRREYSYVLNFGRRSIYRLFEIDLESGRQEPLAELPAAKPAYMHSFGMTERYLILTELPLVVDPLRLRFSGRPFIENYRWEPDRGVRFHVIDKEDGEVVRTATAEAFFAFHHVNAFEENGRLVIDMVTYPDARIMRELYLDRLRAGEASGTSGRLMRFEFPLRGNEPPTARPLVSDPIELPRINYASVAGRAYRYVWGAGDKGGQDFTSRLLKVDIGTGETCAWEEPGCHPGEPVFVASPSATAEDQGAVLSIVLDAQKGRSFLLALDGATLAEMARAEVPHHIPFHPHGNFLSRSGEWPAATLHR